MCGFVFGVGVVVCGLWLWWFAMCGFVFWMGAVVCSLRLWWFAICGSVFWVGVVVCDLRLWWLLAWVRFGSGFVVHFGFGIDGDCWLWIVMVVADMGRLAVLGSHGGCRRGTAGSFG